MINMKKHPNFIGPITSKKKFNEMIRKGNLNYLGFFGGNKIKAYFLKGGI